MNTERRTDCNAAAPDPVCKYAEQFPQPTAAPDMAGATDDPRLHLCAECRAAGQGCRIAETQRH